MLYLKPPFLLTRRPARSQGGIHASDTHVAMVAGSGTRRGMQNQKMDPTLGLDSTPTRPPSTLTCLLQMLNPRPVPPRLRGRLISSSVPCALICTLKGCSLIVQ